MCEFGAAAHVSAGIVPGSTCAIAELAAIRSAPAIIIPFLMPVPSTYAHAIERPDEQGLVLQDRDLKRPDQGSLPGMESQAGSS
jgi:hypothetical protein